MTKNKIIQALIKIHKKYSRERRSNEDAQMCTLWSTTNPPDILEHTPPFDELVETFDFILAKKKRLNFMIWRL